MKAILTLTIKIPVCFEFVKKARAWEKERGLQYGEDEAHLLADFILNEETVELEIKSELERV